MHQVIDRNGFAEDIWAGCPLPILAEYDGGEGLLLGVSDDPLEAAAHLGALRFVVIPFGSHADGRGFSLAAVLRELGYAGHLRARGHVLVDQFRAALRSGFTDVQIPAELARRCPEHQWRAVALAAGGYRSRLLSA